MDSNDRVNEFVTKISYTLCMLMQNLQNACQYLLHYVNRYNLQLFQIFLIRMNMYR